LVLFTGIRPRRVKKRKEMRKEKKKKSQAGHGPVLKEGRGGMRILQLRADASANGGRAKRRQKEIGAAL